jgi:GTP-binding protein
VDLPGYGYAKISKQQQEEVALFIRDYLFNRGALRVAVLLVDIRRDPQQADAETIQVPTPPTI